MKKLLIFVLALVSTGWAQTSATGALTVAGATCTGNGSTCANLVLNDPYTGAVGIDISGTFVGTGQVEASIDGKALDDSTKTWRAISVTPVASTTTVTSFTAGGAWRVAVSGVTDIRVRCSAYTSGTIVVAMRSSRQAASLGGADKAGFTSGGTTINVLPKSDGAGGLADSALTDNATTVTSTEPILLPNGTCANPALGFSGQANLGYYQASSTQNFCQNSQNKFTIGTGQAVQVASNGIYGFSNNAANSTGTLQTGYSSSGANVHVFGNGTLSDSSGTINAATHQYRGLAQTYFVTGDFTTSGSGTALEAITGLTWTFPATTAMNVKVDCYLLYNQNVAAVAVAFGFQDATVAPTNLAAWGRSGTNTTVFTAGTLAASTTTTATAVVSATPSAITTIWPSELHFFIEQPSNASTSVFTIRVSTATAADTVTIKRGSYCTLQQ